MTDQKVVESGTVVEESPAPIIEKSQVSSTPHHGDEMVGGALTGAIAGGTIGATADRVRELGYDHAEPLAQVAGRRLGLSVSQTLIRHPVGGDPDQARIRVHAGFSDPRPIGGPGR